MSLMSEPLVVLPTGISRLWLRVVLAVTAVALVAVVIGGLAWLFAPVSAPPPRNPFGIGLREAAPTGSLGAYILSIQSGFYRSLQAGIRDLREHGGALYSLLLVGFAYGIFHAAGPGHGKAVISAYLVADEKALRKGLGLSLAAALVQALVAITIVGMVAFVLRATAASMNTLATNVELASFLVMTLLGVLITWRKAGKVLGMMVLSRNPLCAVQGETCDHIHIPLEKLNRLTQWRDMVGVTLAAGIRPCAGALVVLAFAISQGLFAAGIAATFAMALGTALTTSLIAVLAVFAKTLALKIAGGRGASGAIAIAGIELLAAAFVLVLGVSLLAGVSAS
jgi:nickel/cobalt transporter (NicO) family protein